jgi:hypothetical protein
MGMTSGVPYTVAEDEKTKLWQLCFAIAYDVSFPVFSS